MNEEKRKELKKKLSYGTTEYFEISLREMIDSVFCYNDGKSDYEDYLNNKYITSYYTDTSFNRGNARLTKENTERIVKEQVDYLCKHARIKRNVFTDDEGVSYNSLIFD